MATKKKQVVVFQLPVGNIVRNFAGKTAVDGPHRNKQQADDHKHLRKIFISSTWTKRSDDVAEVVRMLTQSHHKFDVVASRFRAHQALSSDVCKAIIQDIVKCQLFLLFFDENYESNAICRYEFMLAHRLGKPLLPIKLGAIKAAAGWLPYPADDTRWIDFTTAAPDQGGMLLSDAFVEITNRLRKMFPSLRLNEVQSAQLLPASTYRRTQFATSNVPVYYSYFSRKLDEHKILNLIRDVCKNVDTGCLAILGSAGIGKTTFVSQLFHESAENDSFFVQKCSVNVVLWLNCWRWRNEADFDIDAEDEFVKVVARIAERAASILSPEFEDSFFDLQGIATYFKGQQRRVLFVLDDFSNTKLLNLLRTNYAGPFYCLAIAKSLPEGSASMFAKTYALTEKANEPWLADLLEATPDLKYNKLERKQIIALSKSCFGCPLVAKSLAARFNATSCEDVTAEFNLLMSLKLTDKQNAIAQLFNVGLKRLDSNLRKTFYAFLLFEPGEPVWTEDLAILWGFGGDENAKVKSQALCRVFEREAFVQRVRVDGHQKVREEDAVVAEELGDRFSVHSLLFDVAVRSVEQSKDGNLLETIRANIATGWACVCNNNVDEPNNISVAYEAVTRHRLRLVTKIFEKLGVTDLASLCSRPIESEQNKTFLHFVFESLQVEDSLPLVWKLAKRLGRDRFVDLLRNQNSGDTNMFTLLFQKLDNSGSAIQSAYVPRLVAALKPLRRLYAEENWLRSMQHPENGDQTMMAVLKGDQALFEQLNEALKEKTLVSAARCGLLDTVKLLWEQMKVNKRLGKKLAEPILTAAGNGHFDVIRFFSEEVGRDLVEAEDEEGFTPLMHAISNGHLEIATFLLGNFGHVGNLPLEKIAMTLFATVLNGHVEAVKFLYEQFPVLATENITESKGRTALHVAALLGQLEIVEFLCKIGGPTLAAMVDGSERTALAYAASSGCLDVVRHLYDVYPDGVKVEDVEGSTPLLIATTTGDIGIVKFLHAKHPDAALMTNRNDWSPLMYAVDGGHYDLVEFLLEKAADSAKWHESKTGDTPVMHAVNRGHRDVVRLLARKCPDALTLKNNAGFTPLALAATAGDLALVKILCEYCSDAAKVQSEPGVTPLMLAAQNGHESIVRFLYLIYPSAVKMANSRGLTPGAVAATSGHLNIAEAIDKLR